MLAFIAGALTGVLSGWGVGGGTLLMIIMTAFLGVTQHQAQGTNLMYFIPTSLTALFSHVKNGFIEKRTLIPAALSGAVFSVMGALAASALETEILRRIFGIFLVITGILELFYKSKDSGH